MGSFLDRLRKSEEERKPKYETDNSMYIHWNAGEMEPSVIRFVPYIDKYTQNFYSHKILIPMEFDDPENEGYTVKFKAPCREMYVFNEKCPVAAVVSALYSDAKEAKDNGDLQEHSRLRKIGGAHWKDQSYNWQGFVNRCPFKEEEASENPIRIFPFNKKIHEKLYASLFQNKVNPFKNSPTGEFTMDDVHLLIDGQLEDADLWKFQGIDFILQYSETKGDNDRTYKDWLSHSSWDRESTMLEPEQLAALAEYGFHDMSKRLPERPSEEQYELLAEMMQISIDRMRHGAEGVWQQSWTDQGFKYYRDKRGSKAGGTEAASSDLKPSNVTNRVKSAVGGGNNVDTKSIVENTLASLNKGRGVEAVASDGDGGAVVSDSSPVPAPETKEDMASRVRAAMLAKTKSA